MSGDQIVTAAQLVADLAELGVSGDGAMLVHSSLGSVGWIVGGAAGVVHALRLAIGRGGTLIVPTHTSQQSDPSRWRRPPVPPERLDAVRAAMLPFDPRTTPSMRRGAVAEYVRTHPAALRSNHPTASFAALGPAAARIVGDQPPATRFGPDSPLGRCYDLRAQVMLLGVGHESNTSLHLAEHLATWPTKRFERLRMKALVDGSAVWLEHDDIAIDSTDFPDIGAAFEAAAPAGVLRAGTVGFATTRVFDMRALVEFAVEHIAAHRGRDRGPG